MRVAKFGRVQLITAVCLLVVFHLATIVATAEIEGEYLEARSVDVYTGACHFGSDYVEGGREATLVWKIESGTWNNVSLSGLTIVAVVSADQNLDLDQNTRRSVLYLDPQVTPAQQQVVVDLMQTKRSAVVGQVVAVKKGCCESTFEAAKIQNIMNQQAAAGREFVWMQHESQTGCCSASDCLLLVFKV